jgi:ABC-type glycerol-3-phosphate transport system substrate-binding protein
VLKKLSQLITVIFLLSSSLLFGLGCKNSGINQAAIAPTTLEMWTVYDDVDELQALINKYTANRPYLSVKIRQLRPDELYPNLVEALADDKGPDIVSISNRAMTAMKNRLAPMPPIIKDATVEVVKGMINSETVVTPITKKGLSVNDLTSEYIRTVKNDVVMDNKVYGLPLSVDTMAIYYNKDLLDRAQIAEPAKSWEELQKTMEKLTKYDKDGKIVQSGAALGTGNNIPGFDDLLVVLFKQSGLNFVNSEGRPVFQQNSDASSPSMQVLNFYTDFANPNRKTYSWNENMPDALERFTNGSVAYFFGYSFHGPIIKARAPALNVGITPLLQLNPENPVNAANYWVQAVTLKSRHQDAAWGLIDYLAHSPATKEYIEKTGRPTALRIYASDQLTKPELYPFVSQLLVADNWYHGSDYSSASKAVADMLHEWIQPIPDDADPVNWRQKILNRAASRIDQTL